MIHSSWSIDQWKNIIWSDESRYKLFYSDGRQKIWRQSYERYLPECLRKTVQGDGRSIMIWGCFCGYKLVPWFVINERLNSSRYIRDVLSKFYIPMFEDHPHICFQQDNAPAHRASHTRNWFDKKNLAVLSWPVQSPDLNPIESLWGILQRQINARESIPMKLHELKVALLQALDNI